MLIHPTRDNSSEATLERASELIEKLRSEGKRSYCIAIAGEDGEGCCISFSNIRDKDLHNAAAVLQFFSQRRVEQSFSEDDE